MHNWANPQKIDNELSVPSGSYLHSLYLKITDSPNYTHYAP